MPKRKALRSSLAGVPIFASHFGQAQVIGATITLAFLLQGA